MDFKENDQVKRKKVSGCKGVVTEIREEAGTLPPGETEKPKLIKVLWDNGTESYLAPEALETCK